MTKVYVLSSGDQMDDYELHGIFSRYWKAVKACLILSVIEENKELQIGEYELDELEQIYAEVQSGQYWYILSTQRHLWVRIVDGKPTTKHHEHGEWWVHKQGIDKYLSSPYDNEWSKSEHVSETDYMIYAQVKATSPEEAIEKAEKLLAENKDAK